jgi:hypothetical protein
MRKALNAVSAVLALVLSLLFALPAHAAVTSNVTTNTGTLDVIIKQHMTDPVGVALHPGQVSTDYWPSFEGFAIPYRGNLLVANGVATDTYADAGYTAGFQDRPLHATSYSGTGYTTTTVSLTMFPSNDALDGSATGVGLLQYMSSWPAVKYNAILMPGHRSTEVLPDFEGIYIGPGWCLQVHTASGYDLSGLCNSGHAGAIYSLDHWGAVTLHITPWPIDNDIFNKSSGGVGVLSSWSHITATHKYDAILPAGKESITLWGSTAGVYVGPGYTVTIKDGTKVLATWKGPNDFQVPTTWSAVQLYVAKS